MLSPQPHPGLLFGIFIPLAFGMSVIYSDSVILPGDPHRPQNRVTLLWQCLVFST
jgi:hypothetical protein